MIIQVVLNALDMTETLSIGSADFADDREGRDG